MNKEQLLNEIPHKVNSQKKWVPKNQEFAKIENLLMKYRFTDQELLLLEKRIMELKADEVNEAIQ